MTDSRNYKGANTSREKMREMSDADLARHLLSYNPNTGVFRWKRSYGNRAQKGARAGCRSVIGYWFIGFRGKTVLAHRLAWLHVYGYWPPAQIDHINHDRADNRISNLRLATNQSNHTNLPMRRTNTSGFTGVSFYRALQKWQAKICINSKQIHLGFYEEKDDAITARKEALKNYGFSERHGEKSP